MRLGYHLPQFGDAAVAGAIERAAVRSEELGFDDVWVSDHLVVPATQPRPHPHLYDPLMALAFAGAATRHIGLGTSVLVATQYPSPLAVANSLASLDHLSGGRLVLGVGMGWSQAEFDALGAPFDRRGARLEEILGLWRQVWTHDPAGHRGRHYPSFSDMRVLPQPSGPVPIWLGGLGPVARRRATELGDGYAGVGLTPAQATEVVAELRERRPEETFTISVRVALDDGASEAQLLDLVAEYDRAGVQHLLFAPDRGDPGRGGIDAWIAEMERVADAVVPDAAERDRPVP